MRTVRMTVVLALVAAFPRIVAAQSPETPAPPIVEAGPRPLDSRPMRFLLSTGAVVIGTRIGERPDAIGVQTPTGIVTVYKADIVTMDYRVEAGRHFDLRSNRVPLAPSAPPVPIEAPRRAERRGHPGRGATIAGGVIFGLSYSLACLGSLFATSFGDSEGMLLAIPVVGPVLWGATDRDRISAGLILTGAESLGAALLIHGIITAGQSDEPRRGRFVSVAPLLSPLVQGIAVAGTL